jgi:predicted nucleotidyltransferase
MLERTWKYGETQLFRAEKLYTAQNYQSFIETFRKNFPDYIYYCYLRNKELISALLSSIERVYVPKECLSALMTLEHPDTLQKMALNLISLLSKESGVGMDDFGIHGSIALNMHAPESEITRLVNDGVLSYIFSNRLDAARLFQGRYLNKIFMFNATRKPEEVKVKYGMFRYSSIDPVRFQCTVSDDTENMFRPATYKIANYKPLDSASELPLNKIPDRVISNIGCYRNVAHEGGEIKVSGKLERVEKIKTGDVFYQIVVGTATSEEEYIWPL